MPWYASRVALAVACCLFGSASATVVPMAMNHVLMDLANITMTAANSGGAPPVRLIPLFVHNTTLFFKPPAVTDQRLYSIDVDQPEYMEAPKITEKMETFVTHDCEIVAFVQVHDEGTYVLCSDRVMEVAADGTMSVMVDGVNAGRHYRPGFLAVVDAEAPDVELMYVSDQKVFMHSVRGGYTVESAPDTPKVAGLDHFDASVLAGATPASQSFLLNILPTLGIQVVVDVPTYMATRRSVAVYPTDACEVAHLASFAQFTMPGEMGYGTPSPASASSYAKRNTTLTPHIVMSAASGYVSASCNALGRTRKYCEHAENEHDCFWDDARQMCEARPCVASLLLAAKRHSAEGAAPELTARFATPLRRGAPRDVHVMPDMFTPDRQLLVQYEGAQFLQARVHIAGPRGAVYFVAHDYAVYRLDAGAGGRATLVYDPQLPQHSIDNGWVHCDVEAAGERLLMRYYYRTGDEVVHYVQFSDGTRDMCVTLRDVEQRFVIPMTYGWNTEGLQPLGLVAVHHRLFFALHMVSETGAEQRKELWGIDVSGEHCLRHASFCDPTAADFIATPLSAQGQRDCYAATTHFLSVRNALMVMHSAAPESTSPSFTVWQMPQAPKVRRHFPASFDNVWFVTQCVLMTLFYGVVGITWYTTVKNKRESLEWLETVKKQKKPESPKTLAKEASRAETSMKKLLQYRKSLPNTPRSSLLPDTPQAPNMSVGSAAAVAAVASPELGAQSPLVMLDHGDPSISPTFGGGGSILDSQNSLAAPTKAATATFSEPDSKLGAPLLESTAGAVGPNPLLNSAQDL